MKKKVRKPSETIYYINANYNAFVNEGYCSDAFDKMQHLFRLHQRESRTIEQNLLNCESKVQSNTDVQKLRAHKNGKKKE